MRPVTPDTATHVLSVRHLTLRACSSTEKKGDTSFSVFIRDA
jgi:hypothetical protein